jgi:hypothetical protein
MKERCRRGVNSVRTTVDKSHKQSLHKGAGRRGENFLMGDPKVPSRE